MLTIQIDDAQLEQRIQEQADASGRSAQSVIKELLSAALPILEHPHLEPTEHGYIIADPLDLSSEQSVNTTLFGQVTDAADYVSTLRKTAWRRS